MDIAMLLTTILKCTLHNCFLLPHLTGAVWITMTAFVGDVVADALLDEAGKYNEAVQAEGKGHKRGSPHLHLAVRLVDGMMAHPGVSARSKTRLQYFQEKYIAAEDAELEDLGNTFLYLRAKRAHKKEDEEKRGVLIGWAVSSLAKFGNMGEEWNLQEVLLQEMLAIGWIRKVGPPPKNELERSLERWLAKLGGEGGGKKE